MFSSDGFKVERRKVFPYVRFDETSLYRLSQRSDEQLGGLLSQLNYKVYIIFTNLVLIFMFYNYKIYYFTFE